MLYKQKHFTNATVKIEDPIQEERARYINQIEFDACPQSMAVQHEMAGISVSIVIDSSGRVCR